VRDGLSPLAAWHAGTGLAAQQIGQPDAGTLAAGQRADLLICKGDVLAHPELLDQGALVDVLKDGLGHRNGLPGIPQRDFRSTVRAALEREVPERAS
jgi:hypothetical protein